ncbi:MAG: 16S rRNA (adenine(1518)-N(6)/adenine(1519)-N(6))-dimethyltransferase RsmA [Nocardioidaceae bacterium]
MTDQHGEATSAGPTLLGPADVRSLAAEAGIRPTKQRGQNFVIDPNTVRRIVRTAGVRADDVVVEVGPGLGSLTLGLLAGVARVVAIEVDPALGRALPATVRRFAPGRVANLEVLTADALRIESIPGPRPTALVANLPYNVAVPVLLHLFALLPSLRRTLVMVQAEVADRLAASPGSRTYGIPSAKAAWFADVRAAGDVGRSVFWPVPNVDSRLLRFDHRPPPETTAARDDVFRVVDAVFAQRRKTMRSTLAALAGSPKAAEVALRAAGLDPRTRGEAVGIEQFASIAEVLGPHRRVIP